MNKTVIGFIFGLVGLGAVAVIAGPTIYNTTLEYHFKNGIRSASYLDLSGNAVLQAGDEGETIVNVVDGTFDLTRDEAGTVTVTASDNDATAALTILPGGAAALTLGGVSTTSVTVVTDASSGNGEVVLPAASISAAELMAATLRVSYCGQLAENGTIYLGTPALTAVEPALADATCDALDSGTESTADVILSAGLTLYPKYMRCTSNGTLGSGETIVAQLRDDTTSVTGLTCTIAEAQTECEVLLPDAAAIVAGSATAVRAIETSNNSDDDLKCMVLYDVH